MPETFFLPFPAPKDCLHFLAHGPSLHLQSALLHPLLPSSHLISTLSLLPSSYKDLCDYFVSTRIIQHILPILRLLT